MQDVPFDRFLRDLADLDVHPDPGHIQNHDVDAIWAEIPASEREAYLRELGLPVEEDLQPRLEGSMIVFEEDATPEPGLEGLGLDQHIPDEGPALAAARMLDQIDPEQLETQTREDDEEDGPPDAAAQGEALAEEPPAEGPELVEAETVSLDEADGFPEEAPGLESPPVEPVEEEEEDDPLEEIEELSGDALEEVDPESSEPREVEIYPVYEPYAYVRISYDEDDHQYLYEVIEPELTDREEKVLDFIQETIIDVIDVGLSELSEEEAEEMLVDLTNEVIEDYSIEVDENTRLRLTYYVVRDFLGYGKLDTIMRDPMIEDVNCDGVGVPIFLYHRKYESMASTVVFQEHEELDSFVIKLAQRSGKHISIADPLLDARLPDGSRLNATLSDEVTTKGSTFTIRKFRDEPFTPPDLIRFGTMSEEMLAYYWMSIQHGASMIVAGGTASGKTTLLNAVMLFIPPQMKIVSIEDTRELNLPHPNWIPGTTRSGFGPRDDKGQQAGEINMFQLLKAALRQRPEYITVGEVRGEEATVLFQAMATGHAAYGTMHADSVTSVIHRLEGEPINIPRPLLEALDIVCIQIQTRIGGKRVRRTKEIVEIVGMDPNTKELLTNEVFSWDPADDSFEASGISYVLERIQKEENLSRPELEEEIENRTQIIRWMKENEVRDYVDVAKVVQAYYNEPDALMETIRVDLGLEEAQERSTDVLSEVLDDTDREDPEDAFDPTAEIPVPEDAAQVSPLEDDQLDQLGTVGDEFDPVEDAADEDEPPEEVSQASPEEGEGLDAADPGPEEPAQASLEEGPDPTDGIEPLDEGEPLEELDEDDAASGDAVETGLEGVSDPTDGIEPLEDPETLQEDPHPEADAPGHDDAPDGIGSMDEPDGLDEDILNEAQGETDEEPEPLFDDGPDEPLEDLAPEPEEPIDEILDEAPDVDDAGPLGLDQGDEDQEESEDEPQEPEEDEERHP